MSLLGCLEAKSNETPNPNGPSTYEKAFGPRFDYGQAMKRALRRTKLAETAGQIESTPAASDSRRAEKSTKISSLLE